MQILIAEDERITRRKLQRQLEQMGHEVLEAADGGEAWEIFQSQSPSIVICDWEMPKMNGVDLVRAIRAADNPTYVYIVMLTGKSEKEDVVAGIEAGADDFVTKPFDRSELRARLNAGLRIVELEHHLAAANDRLRHELAVARELANAEHRRHEESLIGESIPVRALRDGIGHYATMNDPLLLTGPSGAGQEAVARAIHLSSPRRDRPFIFVACPHIAGTDDTLLGFGSDHAHEGHFGKASLADGGTLYLECVETLSQQAQVELAHFLDDIVNGRSTEAKDVPDVRVIAYQSPENAEGGATLARELEQLLGANRLAVPSLAERREDIIAIADNILDLRARSVGKVIDGFDDSAEEMMQQYSWPGNVRELQNVVERAVVLANGTRVGIPEELLREGRRVGGYTLQRKLGAGAMGEVWLAKHSLLARPSAVKLIRQDALRGDVKAREILEGRFQREAQATAQLRSPHAVELYDFGVTEDGDFYYVMEYLRGIDLDSLVSRFGALKPARAAGLLRQACMSLGEAHAAGLVHRDVKPANLFACQLGPHYDFLKLLDFGIVKSTADVNKTITSKGQIAGTPTSLSPEVIDGEDATAASDLYGLGCVAYWLLAGQHPFEGESLMALLIKHATKMPTPLTELNPDVPDEINSLVMQCLAKAPSERPKDAFAIDQTLAAMELQDGWDQREAQVWWSENLSTLTELDLQDERRLSSAMDETVTMVVGDTDS